jgi:hypothetical protein
MNYNHALQNESLRIPETFTHMQQWLSYCPDKNWSKVQEVANKALTGELQFEHKIKPSSWRKIASKSAFHNIRHLTAEYSGHYDTASETHLGGGLHEALKSALQIVGGWIGGKKLNSWFAGEKEVKPIKLNEKTMAKLVQATYQDHRAEHMQDWTRIPELDSLYGSFWRNPEGKYVLSVRGTKLHWKDIFSDMKIAGGSQGQSDDSLIDSMKKFNELHPQANLSVAAHSLGSQLVWNGMKAEKIEGVKDLYLFNPASSPFQDEKSVRDIADSDYNTRYFLNTSDVVSNLFSQRLTPQEIDATVSYGPFSRNPLSAHSLSQWADSVETY